MTLVIDFGRELGLPLRGLHLGQHVGWTTDRAKAETMAGVTYRHTRIVDGEPQEYEGNVRAHWTPTLDKRPEARKFAGWEISFPVGAELAELGSFGGSV